MVVNPLKDPKKRYQTIVFIMDFAAISLKYHKNSFRIILQGFSPLSLGHLDFRENFFLKQYNLVLKFYRKRQTQRLNIVYQLTEFIEYFYLTFLFMCDT